MKYKDIAITMILFVLMSLLAIYGVIGIATHYSNKYNTTLKTENQQPSVETITLNEDFTLIRTSDDYIYLSSLTINRDIWEGATKQTDINGVTWYEIMQDGYIKVYAEGHVPPHEVHWYAAY
jgi:predicted ATPase